MRPTSTFPKPCSLGFLTSCLPGAALLILVLGAGCSLFKPRACTGLTSVFTADPKRRDQAAKLFQQAEEHYKANRFHQAIPRYIKAYEILRLPAFLFNIGQCHRMLGNYNLALFYFKGYLRSGYIPQRDLVEQLLQKMLKLVAAKERRAEEAGRRELETKWRALRAKQRELERQRKALVAKRRALEKQAGDPVGDAAKCGPNGDKPCRRRRKVQSPQKPNGPRRQP